MRRVPPLSDNARRMRHGAFAELQARIDERAALGHELVPLHIGDTHVAPPDEASRELSRAPAAGDLSLYRYGPTAGLADLTRAAAARVREKYGVAWATDACVTIGSGGTHALFCAARAILDPGDRVILCAPYWPLAPGIFHACGAAMDEVSLSQRLYADPKYDITELLTRALNPRTKAVYFVSPNNPDGKILTEDHLLQIARFAEAHDLWVFADEVYADITYARPHASFGAIDGTDTRTVLLYSFSKSHALAGARIGFAIAPPEVTNAARRVSVHTVFNVPVSSQRAAVCALNAGDAWTTRALHVYRSARDAVCKELAREKFRFFAPDGGSYVFLDFTETLRDRPLRALLERAVDEGVLLAPGDACGEAFTKYARLCFTSVPEPRVLDGIARLTRAVRAFG